MKNSLLKYLVMGFLSVSSIGHATAAVFNFGADNLGVTSAKAYNSVSMTNSGISVDVTALAISNDGIGNVLGTLLLDDPRTGVYVSTSNLAVRSKYGEGTYLNGGPYNYIEPGTAQADLPTNDIDEGLSFNFSQEVTLDYIDFDYFGDRDDFNLMVDGVSVLMNMNNDTSSSTPHVTDVLRKFDEFSFDGISGTNFVFWADHWTDSYRVDTIWVTETAPIIAAPITAVPEPSTFALMGLGLAGIAFAARRRKV